MRHLSRDQWLALVESGEAASNAHLRECPRCRAEVEQARATLGGLRQAGVPEPSPLFWDQLSARITAGVAEAADHARARSRGRAGWPVLAPLALVVVALVLAVAVNRGPGAAGPATSRPAAVAAEASGAAAFAAQAPAPELPAATIGGADEGTWALLDDLAGDFDVDTLSESLGTSESAGADVGVYELNAGERARLAELLKTETGRGPGL